MAHSATVALMYVVRYVIYRNFLLGENVNHANLFLATIYRGSHTRDEHNIVVILQYCSNAEYL